MLIDEIAGERENFILCLDDSISVSRSAFSRQPWFYRIDKENNRVEFSVNYWRLVKDRTLSNDYAWDYLSYQVPYTNSTALNGVLLLRSGEKLTFKDGKYCHTSPAYPALEVAFSKDAFRKEVENEIQSIGKIPAAYHLSSGLDSSLLVLLASNLAQIDGCIAVSCKTKGKGATSELDVAKQVAEKAGIEFKFFDYRHLDILDVGREMINGCDFYPLAHPSHIVRFLMDKSIHKLGYSVVVTGRGPDEVLGGYPWHSQEFDSIERHHNRVLSSDTSILNKIFKIRESVQSYENYKDHFSEGYGLNAKSRYDLSTIYESWNVIDHAFSKYFGLSYVSPFILPLIQSGCLSLDEDARQYLAPRGKQFLVDTFRDVYPDYLLSVPKAGLTFDVREYLREYSVGELVRLIICTEDMDDIIKPTGLSWMVEETLMGGGNYGWQIWSLYLLALTSKKMKV
ncbi:MAG: hypothetical protein K0U68_08855 [Gammaproteobacteria bacterium]|nr:hypothetical protein [Gammaproteobacteria bacterium]